MANKSKSEIRLDELWWQEYGSTMNNDRWKNKPTSRFMAFRPLLIAFALMASFLTGCSKSNLEVISAVYGSGANFADVSNRVGDLVRQKSKFVARPTSLQADPSPGWNKTLVIVYEVKGHRHIFTTGEGGNVSATILLEAARQ